MDVEKLRHHATKWMQRAVEEAETALSKGEVPVGAVFVQHKFEDSKNLESFDLENGTIVSTGYNLTNETRNVRALNFQT